MPQGMSHKEYQQFILEVEDSLYDDRPLLFKPDPIGTWTNEEEGVTFTRYHGWKRKTYCQPMMDMKDDHKSFDTDQGYCRRCPGEYQYRKWSHHDDEIFSVTWLPGYNRDGIKVAKHVHFIPYFAARFAHP
jgi:hypothetical protein